MRTQGYTTTAEFLGGRWDGCVINAFMLIEGKPPAIWRFPDGEEYAYCNELRTGDGLLRVFYKPLQWR